MVMVRRNPRFRWRLSAVAAISVLLAVSATGWLATRTLRHDHIDAVMAALQQQASLLGEVARPQLSAAPNQRGFTAQLDRLQRKTGLRLTIIAPDGEVLGDSHHDPARLDNHASRPEVVAAIANRHGSATRPSSSSRNDLVYVAIAVRGEDERLLGIARVATALSNLDDSISQLRGRVALAGLIGAVVAVALAWWAAQRIARPIAAVTAAVEAFAAGDVARRLPSRGGDDEIDRLARAFNALASELEFRLATLSNERNRLQAVLSAMAEGLIAVDPDERILLANTRARELLNVEAPTGRPLWEVCRVARLSELVVGAMTSGDDQGDQITLTLRQRELAIDVRAAPFRDSDGTIAGAVAVLHDLSELRRLEAVRRDFVANVSHELKTPLTAIRGLVETLLDDPQIPAETAHRFLGRIQAQAERLTAIVMDLLTLSRSESKENRQNYEVLDLALLLRSSVAQLDAAIQTRRHDLAVETEPGPAHVRGDPEALRQAIDNLVDNAIKYTPPGGRIRVRLRRESPDEPGSWLLEVEDSGIGIDRRSQERIWERFYRVDKARSREVGGTGLGLSIVKHVILAHEGEVGVRSSPGHGSTFWLRLPALKG